MNKIYILGKNGMLGKYVYTYFKHQNYDVVGLTREDLDAEQITDNNIDVYLKAGKGDVVFNCIGTIKPQVDKLGTLSALKVNAVFPHILNNFCKNKGIKLLHITTDCVFSGSGGDYTELSPHDCTDVYGKTKSLGEFSEYGMVVRTSIIGEELGASRSLIEWIKSMKDKDANGFTNHSWNGVTCLQVAKLFEQILTDNVSWEGVRHFHSPTSVTKYELLKMVSDIYNLNINIQETVAAPPCHRTMRSVNDNPNFNIPELYTQIEEQKEFFDILKMY